MDLQEQLRQLSLSNAGKVNQLVNGIQNATLSTSSSTGRDYPQKKVPQSKIVAEAQEPLYARPLQITDVGLKPSGNNVLLRKRDEGPNSSLYSSKTSKSTLDNPAVLEQQLEALAYHKQQMEKKGLLGQQLMPKARTAAATIPKLSSTSLIGSDMLYTNLHGSDAKVNSLYKNVDDKPKWHKGGAESHTSQRTDNENSNVYTNFMLQKQGTLSDATILPTMLTISTNTNTLATNSAETEDDLPPPPSPVSSSYSELRRAIDVFGGKSNAAVGKANTKVDVSMQPSTMMRKNYDSDYSVYLPTPQTQQSHNSPDYYGYGCSSQNSSAYDSIYEPINPRPPSSMSSHSNCLMYASYVNGGQISGSTTSANLSMLGNINSATNTPTPTIYSSGGTLNSSVSSNMLPDKAEPNYRKENEVEALTDLLVNSMNPGHDVENYGICFKCNERVLGENNGCTAMDQIYHIACFTCWQCQINLQGKPFYALEGKPYCEYDYLQTLEKCSVCMKPILERILRATGKPYHPQCFTCIVCGHSLDGIPFTVDATNQNYCITDFHKKFAPRCCVCKEPIMPESGQEETIRVVALDRSFHLECYKCEDCGLLLSSEAEGRGCYPLDDHVLCKSCNAKRVQLLTNRMTTEL